MSSWLDLSTDIYILAKYKLIYYRDVAFKKCDNAWKICKTFTKTLRLEKNCHQS